MKNNLLECFFRPNNHPVYEERQPRSCIVALKKIIFLCIKCIMQVRKNPKIDLHETKGKIAIVSHAIGGNPKNYSKNGLLFDNYFGYLQSIATTEGIDTIYLYLNHRNTNQQIIGSYYINYYSISIFFKCLYEVFKDYINYSMKQKNIIMKIFVFFNSINHFDILNRMVAKSIFDFVKKNQFSTILYTFEGNLWENYLNLYLKQLSVNPIAYFHGPLRQGFVENLNKHNFYTAATILTKSKIENIQFKKLSNNTSLHIVGSHRKSNVKKISKTWKLNQNLKILVCPEGLYSEIHHLAELSIRLKKQNKNWDISFRFHPNLYDKTQEMKLTKNGVIVSSLSLSDDFENSDICIYRGSTVCFEAGQRNIIPLYYRVDNETMNIDPLNYIIQDHQLRKNYLEIVEFLNDLNHETFVEFVNIIQKNIFDYPNTANWKVLKKLTIF